MGMKIFYSNIIRNPLLSFLFFFFLKSGLGCVPQSSCLSPLSADITGVCHYTWYYSCSVRGKPKRISWSLHVLLVEMQNDVVTLEKFGNSLHVKYSYHLI
jgi:hypothetical protein